MLFISHKSEDSAIANEVLTRCLQRGYGNKQVFLDCDPESGIEAGVEWERKIYATLKHTRAMIVLCSPNWLKSQWCGVELGYAKAMAIAVFPIIIEKCDVSSVLSATQVINLTSATDSSARDAAFARLWTALEGQHLGPKDNLPWPPAGDMDKCPFPGLMYFDERHAPVFFGRDQERDTVIGQLKAMRNNGVPRMLMIVGGSGSGKSSVLRAGVLPWLRHSTEQHDWMVLPTLRYGENPNDDMTLLARLGEVIADSYPQDHPRRSSWRELRDRFDSDDVEQATRDFVDATVDVCREQRRARAQQATAVDQSTTSVLAIDQFEELLTAAARPSAQKFLRFLRILLSKSNGRLLVVGTMRSDYLDTYEQHTEYLKPPFLETYRLPPFPWERVTDVITRPAERVDVTFDPALISRLKEDAPNSDALPLLAFTLEKLFRECATDNLIELREYERFGGMTGAITAAVTRILRKDMSKDTEQALRLSFTKYLAEVNDKGEIVRLTARWSDLPVTALPVIDEFVKERLLVKSARDGRIQVEVAHEAIFRCWQQLKEWLHTSSDILRWRRDVRRSQEADRVNGKKWSGLSRSQLAIARDWRKKRQDELDSNEIAWINAAILWSRIWTGVATATVMVIAVLGLVAWWQKSIADTNAQVANRKTREAAMSLISFLEGRAEDEHDYLASLPWLVEALSVANKNGLPEESHRIRLAELRRLLPLRQYVWFHDERIADVQFDPGGRTIATRVYGSDGDGHERGRLRLLNVADGLVLAETPSSTTVTHAEYSHDGRRLLTIENSRAICLRDALTLDLKPQSIDIKDRALRSVSWNPKSDRLMIVTSRGDDPPTVMAYDTATAKPLTKEMVLYRTNDVLGPRDVTPTMDSTGNLVAFQAASDKIEVWRSTTNTKAFPGLTVDGTPRCMEFSRDAKWLVVGGSRPSNVKDNEQRGAVWIFDADSGEKLFTLDQHQAIVTTLVFSDDGRWLVSACDYDRVLLWRVGEWKAPHAEIGREESTSAVARVVFGPSNNSIATLLHGNTLKVWDVNGLKPLTSNHQHESTVPHIFSIDERRLLLSDLNAGTVNVVNIGQSRFEFGPLRHVQPLRGARFGSDGYHIFTWTDNAVHSWCLPVSGSGIRTVEQSDMVTKMDISKDGSLAVT